MKSKHVKSVLTIFIIAIIVRIIFYFIVYLPFANNYNPGALHYIGEFSWVSDDKYDEIARNLVAGKGYTIRGGTDNKLYPNLIRPPVYPYILAAQFYLFGDGYWINMLMNVLYQSLACIILYYMTLMIFNDKEIAIVASLIWAVYPLPMLEVMGPHTGPIYVLVLSVLAFFFFKFYKYKKTKYLVYFSILLVILTLTRPISLIFPAFFILITFFIREFSLRDKLKQIAIVLIIFIVGITPWMYRGYKITGEIIPLVTYKKPINYYLVDVVNDEGYKKSPKEKFLDEIKNPLGFLNNFVKRLVRYWYYGHFKLTQIANALMQFPLLLISIFGMWKAREQRLLIFPVLLIILYFWLMYSASIALAKYSFPIVILLCPFAATGLLSLLNKINVKKK